MACIQSFTPKACTKGLDAIKGLDTDAIREIFEQGRKMIILLTCNPDLLRDYNGRGGLEDHARAAIKEGPFSRVVIEGEEDDEETKEVIQAFDGTPGSVLLKLCLEAVAHGKPYMVADIVGNGEFAKAVFLYHLKQPHSWLVSHQGT